MCMEFYYVVALHWENITKIRQPVHIHIVIHQVIVC